MRIKRTIVLSALALAVGLGFAQPSAAAPSEPPQAAPKETHKLLVPPTNQDDKRAAGGGGRSRDFTGDGIPDILVRSWGDLYVYPNSGKFNGTNTYPSRELVNVNWGQFSWIGAADMTGDGFADIVAVDNNGIMYVAEHSGTYNGTSTFKPGLTVIGSGWNINRLVYVYDYNGDGFDDLLGVGTNDGVTKVYFNNGGISGVDTLQAPISIIYGGQADVFQGIADVTMDGLPDFVWVTTGGSMYTFSLLTDDAGALGYGWQAIDRIVLTDVDNDGLTDILGRQPGPNTLNAYRHSGTWAPVNGLAYSTYPDRVVVGYNWHINSIIS
jgi:hypothetical protein